MYGKFDLVYWPLNGKEVSQSRPKNSKRVGKTFKKKARSESIREEE